MMSGGSSPSKSLLFKCEKPVFVVRQFILLGLDRIAKALWYSIMKDDAPLRRPVRRSAMVLVLASLAPRPSFASAALDSATELSSPLWLEIWSDRTGLIVTTAALLAVLTLIFFFQDWLVRHAKAFVWLRRAFLLCILVWLGWFAHAQLSVVNILTFAHALITGFRWEVFLAAPLIFILWSAVAAGLLFWGRGPFCGWLCPFGALQELLSDLARFLKIPQIRIPWALHERLWPLKYIIFLGLFGLSMHSVTLAERAAEIEPFKTAIVLRFAREWPYVV